VSSCSTNNAQTPPPASWWAILCVALGAFATVTSEFLPVGLLPAIAQDLGISISHAGLMMAVPGVLAALSAPTCIALFSRVDRKHLLLGLLALFFCSNLVVAFSEQFWLTLAGRVLLGFALGGFWTIAGSLGPRLRPGKDGVRATAYILAGVSLGTVAGIPVGTLLGEAFGWRSAFEAAAGLTVVVALLIAVCLPSLPGQRNAGIAQMLSLVGDQNMRRRFAAGLLICVGHFAAYTFMAPFVLEVAGISGQTLGSLLFAFGLASVAGNLAGGALAARDPATAVLTMTVLMFAALAALLAFGSSAWLLWPVVLVWGFAFGMVPITIQIWCFDASGGRIEGVQALIVCVINLSIGGGAFLGGVVADYAGFGAVITVGALCASLSVVTVLLLIIKQRQVACES
jgi:predicted MFS family arabinose efflux permease